MMLIADSGSTKTHWCIVDAKGKRLIQTIGINPYQMNNKAIQEVLERELYPNLNSETIKDIHFYGAGCSTEQKCNLINSVLQDFFKDANIEIHHDLLGAARALCGHEPGIACILGTGCNACYYDGNEIKEQMNSLGFVLGDEGSGAYMGKIFIRDYYQDAMPDDLKQLFREEFNPVLEEILDNIYNHARPNRFLASFGPFFLKNIEHPYVYKMVSNSFDEFFSKYVLKFKEAKSNKVHFLGSIAYHFSEVLKASAIKAGLQPGRIYVSPIQGLIDYHKN
jgi:N-acetylglucosamine kinase-like BadF-type ATPase